MATPLKLEVLLGAVDKATAPLNRVEKSSTRAGQALRNLRDQQRQLNRIGKDVSGYRAANAELTRNARRLNTVTDRIKQQQAALAKAREAQANATRNTRNARNEYRRLSQAVLDARGSNEALNLQLEKAQIRLAMMQGASNKAASSVRRYNSQLKSAESEGARLNQRQTTLTRDIGIYGDRLREAGVDMNRLREVTQSVRNREDSLTSAIEQQRRQLDQLHASQERVNKARQQYQRGLAVRNQTAVTGTGAIIMAGGIERILKGPIRESERYQNEVARIDGLGQGQQTTRGAVDYAHGHQGYGVSERDTLTLMRDALSIFGSKAHAEVVTPILQQMQFANRARYGEEQGEENERVFMDMLKAIELRGGVNDPAEFKRQANMIQQVINATGGRVNADEWLQVIKTGGISVKGLSDGAFFYKLEPLIQEMGGQRVGTGLMSAYQNLYQGRTTKAAANQMEKLGIIGDRSKVSYDQVGQQAYVGPGALKEGDLFKRDIFGWVDKVLIPQLEKNGIKSQQGIMDAVGSIITNRTGSSVISGYIMQREANQRRAGLNEHADGIDAMSEKARQQAQGKEIELAARRADLYKTMGNAILPAYTKALEVITSAVESLNNWMQRNPRIAQAMLVALAGFGVLVGTFGALALAAAAVMGPVLLARFSIKLLGLQMAETAASGSLLSKALALASFPIKGTGNAARRAIIPIRALGQGIKTAFRGTVTGVRHPIQSMKRLAAAATTSGSAMARWGRETKQAAIASASGGTRTAMNTVTTGIGAITTGVLATLKAPFKGLAALITHPLNSLKTGLGSMLEWIREFFPMLGRAMAAGMEAIGTGALGAALTNPLTIGVAALIAAAALIYKYWDPLKAFFGGLWEGLTDGMASVTQTFTPAINAWAQALTPIKPLWDGIVSVASEAWRWFTNLITPVSGTTESLRGAADAGRSVGAVLADIINTLVKLTARLAEFGAVVVGYLVGAIDKVVNGMASAVNTALGWIKKAVSILPSWAAKSLGVAAIATSAAMPQVSMGDQAGNSHEKDQNQHAPQFNQGGDHLVEQPKPLQFDDQPPVAARNDTPANTDARQYNFTIHAAQGMDPQAVATAVRMELDRRDNEDRARRRSSLTDRG